MVAGLDIGGFVFGAVGREAELEGFSMAPFFGKPEEAAEAAEAAKVEASFFEDSRIGFSSLRTFGLGEGGRKPD